jgi:two-component sensor histidine kinase
LPQAVASDVELLTTEIVSNALKHANLAPIATSWGVEPEGGGKKVWFEVDTR